MELSDDAEVVDDLPNDVDTYLELLKRTRDESHGKNSKGQLSAGA